MAITNFVRGRFFKQFMAKLYGWGASIVILGALFKINHYNYADIMLIVGLGVESLIFFFSAFEPPHVEPDWSLVYPELAGLYHGHSVADQQLFSMKDGPSNELDGLLAKANIDPEVIDKLGIGLKNLSDNTSKLSDISNASIATNEYVKNIKGATVSAGKLTDSYKVASEVLDNDIKVTEDHVINMRNVSASASNLSDTYKQANDSIKTDLSSKSELEVNLKNVSESAKLLAEKYNNSAEILSNSAETFNTSKKEENLYIEQLKKISGNIAALNSAYESQLNGTNKQIESNSKIQNSLGDYLSNLNESIKHSVKYQENLAALNLVYEKQLDGTNKQVESTVNVQGKLNQFFVNLNESIEKTNNYKEEMDSLTNKISSLNNVYGNMLSAMNVKSKK